MNVPRVCVGIPLYGSKAFLGGLRQNLKALAKEQDVTVIVSDRHGLDDTIDVLHDEWREDPRFRFMKATDRLDWVEHMNCLLSVADGDYFRWQPHDDIFPAGCLAPLVNRLDSDLGAILAYGPTRAITATGVRWPDRDRLNTYPVPPGGQWTFKQSLDLFWRGWCNGAFKGLFRRRDVMDAGLLIRPTRDLIFAERAWLFGISLLGGLSEVPESVYYKRFHSNSITTTWNPGPLHIMSATATMCGYLRDFGPARLAGMQGIVHQWLRSLQFIRQRFQGG